MKKIINKDSNKNFKKNFKTVATVAACVTFLSGCGNSLTNYTGVEPQQRNQVEMVRVPFSIQFEAGQVALTKSEVDRLNYFLRTSNVKYGDEFSMDFPLDANGELSDIDAKRLAHMSDLLKESGLYMSSMVTPYGMEPKANSGRLIISKYVVTLPECGWSQPSYPNYENAPLNNIGCSIQANLGLMVANPKDLITGAKGGPVNAERTALAVERYQSRVVTVSEASATEVTGGSQ
ncbi:CpaD family pilus assembly lipoprotein [Pseudemcibacter aquimaris]|uniref:CpaD family pilus assembly lipoprotein n=1 Tax=Pseudemcibacter aquimaris TaxID=2857064 RepID=UPI00201316E3|nr:CpaD family pilus assembly lipoprotein [Pseudemcibacter aquimaris]MCC3861441.1 CpaD family pilus assembly protein [Pseudemcibacter aquimaris]WDU58210.1 CpaD family pilus assembly protein [Pseudemcibacter aquimaris]